MSKRKVTATVRCDVQESFEVANVRGMFDLAVAKTAQQTFTAELPADDEWRLGVIVGPSGSGKSTIARQEFPESFVERFDWDVQRAVISQMGGTMKDSTYMLASVGFSSPPSWIKPYHVLSGGERFRCDLARALLLDQPLVVFDEFTSVVDRTVAKIGSAAIAKSLRKTEASKRFIAVTCHYDVIDWLEPDWVLDMASGELARGCLWRRPPIELQVVRATPAIWSRFRQHHYLDGTINKASRVFVGLVEGEPVGMVAVIHYPHPSGMYWREHRTVVLPDYQGVGIGNRLSEFTASLFAATGRPYFVSTLHPSHTHHRVRSPLWTVTSKAQRRTRAKSGAHLGVGKSTATSRMKMSFRYVGPADAESARRFGVV